MLIFDRIDRKSNFYVRLDKHACDWTLQFQTWKKEKGQQKNGIVKLRLETKKKKNWTSERLVHSSRSFDEKVRWDEISPIVFGSNTIYIHFMPIDYNNVRQMIGEQLLIDPWNWSVIIRGKKISNLWIIHHEGRNKQIELILISIRTDHYFANF